MYSLSKKQSILSKETIQNAFFFRIMPLFQLRFLSSIKHPTAESWLSHAVLGPQDDNYFYQLPDDKMSDWSKLKQVANDILKCI